MSASHARMGMRVDLARIPKAEVEGLRAPNDADAMALGTLMFHAYQGTVDSEGETEAQATEEITRTFAGAYGPIDLLNSRVIERDGSIVSATLITRWKEQPFVAFSMTHPQWKGQGLARACMAAAMNALVASGRHELSLVVTAANEPAVRLYRRLGFVPTQ